jgi:hypothetical protein
LLCSACFAFLQYLDTLFERPTSCCNASICRLSSAVGSVDTVFPNIVPSIPFFSEIHKFYETDSKMLRPVV